MRRIQSDDMRPFITPAGAVELETLATCVTPSIEAAFPAGANRILPFGLSGQAKQLLGPTCKPTTVAHGIKPGHGYYRLLRMAISLFGKRGRHRPLALLDELQVLFVGD